MTMMRIETLMNGVPQRCVRSDTLQDVARRMWSLGCTSLPLCDGGGELLGQLDARSIYRLTCIEDRGARELRVSDAPIDPTCSCRPDTEIPEAWALMTAAKASRLFVVDSSGRLVGVVARKAIVQADDLAVAKIRVCEDGADVPAADGWFGWTLIAAQSRLITPTGEVRAIKRNLLRLLQVFLDEPGVALSRTVLLQRVCNRRWEPSDRYIDVLVGQLRRKFSERRGSERVIRTAYGTGYICMLEVERIRAESRTGQQADSTADAGTDAVLRSLDARSRASRARSSSRETTPAS